MSLPAAYLARLPSAKNDIASTPDSVLRLFLSLIISLRVFSPYIRLFLFISPFSIWSAPTSLLFLFLSSHIIPSA